MCSQGSSYQSFLCGRRREGYEFMIGPPKVINREVNGKKLEPFEVKLTELSSRSAPLVPSSLPR